MTGTIRNSPTSSSNRTKTRGATARKASGYGRGGESGEHNRKSHTDNKFTSAKRRRVRQRERELKDFTLSEQLGNTDREWWAARQDSDAELFPSKWELQEARMENEINCATLDLSRVHQQINEISEELDVRQSYVDCWRGAGEGPFPFVQRNVGWACTSTSALRLRLEEEEDCALHLEEKIRLLRGGSPRVISTVPCAEESCVVYDDGASVAAVASADQECNGYAGESSETDDDDDAEMDRRFRANQSVARLQWEHERKDKWIWDSVLVKNYMVCLLQCHKNGD